MRIMGIRLAKYRGLCHMAAHLQKTHYRKRAMIELYFTQHPHLRRPAVGILSTAFMLVWAAAMIGLGGCESTREGLRLPFDLEEAISELRRAR